MRLERQAGARPENPHVFSLELESCGWWEATECLYGKKV